MAEQWRDVPGYEGQYRVSNYGRVMSHVAKKPDYIKVPVRTPAGYLQTQLKVNQKPDTRLIHTLVDEAFNGPRVPGLEVNHMDGDKANNRLDNLERVTRRENVVHAWAMGLCSDRKREKHPQARMSENLAAEIRAAVGPRTPAGRVPRGRLAALPRSPVMLALEQLEREEARAAKKKPVPVADVVEVKSKKAKPARPAK